MKKGISINVGINKVTSTIFSSRELKGCENDARAMHAIATTKGFDPALSSLIVGEKANFENVVSAISTAAGKLEAGDLFLFSFAGHGTRKTIPPGSGELDNHDESIVLADHLIIDNFWRHKLWPLFKPGVRAIAVADCCHADTILQALTLPQASDETGNLSFAASGVATAELSRRAVGASSGVNRRVPLAPNSPDEWENPATRLISDEEREKEITHFGSFYDKQLETSAKPIEATRVFLSACQDRQKAFDGKEHGAFTKALLEVWDGGNFNGSYVELIAKIREKFNNTNQTPSLTQLGNPDFRVEEPFTI